MASVNSFPVWRKELLVLVTGFCCCLLICLRLEICQGKAQQKKKK